MSKFFFISLFLLAFSVASADSSVWTCTQGGKQALTISVNAYSAFVIEITNPQISQYLNVPSSFTAFSMYAPNAGLLVIPGEYAIGILLSSDNGGMRLSSAWIDRENDTFKTGKYWYFNPGECVRY